MESALEQIVIRREKIFGEIHRHREFQDRKWGADRRLPPQLWMTIAGEEFGEMCDATFSNGKGDLRDEAIQLASVCVALVEAIDQDMLAELVY